MVYLYAALGVVMMTGIMAIFEMGLSLTGKSPFFDPLPLEEQQNSMKELKELDKTILRLLYQDHEVTELDPIGSPKATPPLKSSALCDQVMCRINGTNPCLGEESGVNTSMESLKEIAQASSSPLDVLSGSCALGLGKKYRFLIHSDSQIDVNFPYRLFSCALKYEGIEPDLIYCNFESSL